MNWLEIFGDFIVGNIHIYILYIKSPKSFPEMLKKYGNDFKIKKFGFRALWSHVVFLLVFKSIIHNWKKDKVFMSKIEK